MSLAQPDEYALSVESIVPADPSDDSGMEDTLEDELADALAKRIEVGDIALEDIPVRMARYGLMDRDAFISEVRERALAED